jgi:GT2 family glycosyltransferase
MRFWKLKSINDNPLVGMVVVTYNQIEPLQSLLASLKAQTWKNFKIAISHDGPATPEVKAAVNVLVGKDDRFIFIETRERQNKFGHDMRYPGFSYLASLGCTHLCTTNGDCWYTPNYFENMLYKMQKDSTKMCICNMIHSHKLWQPLNTEMARGKVDVGCWMASTEVVKLVNWTDYSFAADWFFIKKLFLAVKGKISKVDGYLYVHN